jgi:hypothetical protein
MLWTDSKGSWGLSKEERKGTCKRSWDRGIIVTRAVNE